MGLSRIFDLRYWAMGVSGVAVLWGLLGIFGMGREDAGARAFAQNQVLVGWITLYAVTFFLFYHRLLAFTQGKKTLPQMLLSAATSVGGWAVLLTLAVGALMLITWLKLHPSHKAPVFFKIAAQVAVITVVLVLMFKFWEWMGSTILPHIMGVHVDEGWIPGLPDLSRASWWVRPGPIVLFPFMLNFFLALAVALFAFMLYGSLSAYGLPGLISTQGLCSLLAFFFVLGPAWEYRKTMRQWRADFDAARARHATLAPPPGADPGDIVTSESVRLGELRYGTRVANLLTFHRLPDDRHGLAYSFPGFLIGVEKANRYLIDVRDPPKANLEAARKAGIKGLLDERRTAQAPTARGKEYGEGLKKYDPEAFALMDDFYSGRIAIAKVERPNRQRGAGAVKTDLARPSLDPGSARQEPPK